MSTLNPRHVRVESDGTKNGSHVYIDGEILINCTNVTFTITPDGYSQATLTLIGVEVDLLVDPAIRTETAFDVLGTAAKRTA